MGGASLALLSQGTRGSYVIQGRIHDGVNQLPPRLKRKKHFFLNFKMDGPEQLVSIYPMDPSFYTYRSGQIVQIQTRLLFKAQSDLDLHCFQCSLQFYDASPNSKPFFFFFFFFFIQFNVPFKIISLIETSQSIGGRNRRTPGKPPDTPASRTWLVSYVASEGLKPTPDTGVR